MRELKTANHLLGNRAALAKAFEEDGYLFFRKVLDINAVLRLRNVYLDTLREIGVVDRDSDEPTWNGASLDDFSIRMRSLTAKEPWKGFRDDPAIRQWLREFIGEDYTWVPSIVYRVTPPGQSRATDPGSVSRFKRVHQDGYDWAGFNFLVCWVPLMHIDHDVGGMVIAEGCHKNGFLHDTAAPTMFEVTQEKIPAEAWAWADFDPGDIVLQNVATPHTGISNQSMHFRMSMDFRVLPESAQQPLLGTIVSIDPDQISLCIENGSTLVLEIDDETFCPGRAGGALRNRGCIPRAELQQYLSEGSAVIVTYKEKRARLIRGVDIGHRA